jgi:hypothetical protein
MASRIHNNHAAPMLPARSLLNRDRVSVQNHPLRFQCAQHALKFDPSQKTELPNKKSMLVIYHAIRTYGSVFIPLDKTMRALTSFEFAMDLPGRWYFRT